MTDQQYITLIMIETGTSNDPIVSAAIASWWTMSTARGKYGWFAYLYTKQSVLRYLLGLAKRRRDIVIGQNTIKSSQLYTNAMGELKDWNDFITANDPNIGTPPVTTHTPSKNHLQLDSVFNAYEFARRVNPYIDDYVGSSADYYLWQ